MNGIEARELVSVKAREYALRILPENVSDYVVNAVITAYRLGFQRAKGGYIK